MNKHKKAIQLEFSELTTEVPLGDLIGIIYEITPSDGYNQLKFNGTHFTKAMMKQLKREKKGNGSVLKSKLVRPNVGFDLK